MANYGLYVYSDYAPIRGHPYVYSVELGTSGADDMASSGRRLPGADGAFNTLQQPDLHGRDIKDLAPTVHLPWPARLGETPVSDGSKYTAQPARGVTGGIVRYPPDGGDGTVYEFSADGLNAAAEDAEAGDRIEITGAGEIDAADFEIPDGVHLAGPKTVTLLGPIYGGELSTLEGLTVLTEATSGDAVGVYGPEGESLRVMGCDITADNTGGDAYGVSTESGGHVLLEKCVVRGLASGGSGYAGRSLYGKIKVRGGKASGTTDNWYIRED
jgi:hypothetical protein